MGQTLHETRSRDGEQRGSSPRRERVARRENLGELVSLGRATSTRSPSSCGRSQRHTASGRRLSARTGRGGRLTRSSRTASWSTTRSERACTSSTGCSSAGREEGLSLSPYHGERRRCSHAHARRLRSRCAGQEPVRRVEAAGQRWTGAGGGLKADYSVVQSVLFDAPTEWK